MTLSSQGKNVKETRQSVIGLCSTHTADADAINEPRVDVSGVDLALRSAGTNAVTAR